MPTLRGTVTQQAATLSGGTTVTRPTGLQADDRVLLIVACDDNMGSVSASGFTQIGSWYNSSPNVTHLAILEGTGFSGAGSFTVTPSNSGAWPGVMCAAWEDAGGVVIGSPLQTNGASGAVPGVAADGRALLAACQSYAGAPSLTPGASLIGNITGSGSSSALFDRGAQFAPGSSVTATPASGRAFVAVQIVVEPASEPETYDVTGTLALDLDVTATAAKTSGSAGAVTLGLATGDDTAKAGETVGPVGVDLAAAGDALKTATTLGALGIGLTADGQAVKVATVEGDVTLTLSADGTVTTTEDGTTTGALELALTALAVAAKTVDVTGTLTLALDLAADPVKLAAVAGAVGVDLGLTGTASSDGDGASLGALALTVAIVATATKTVDTTGTVGLDLTIAGTTGRTAATIGTLELALAVAALSGDRAPNVVGPLTITVHDEHLTITGLDRELTIEARDEHLTLSEVP